MSNHAAPKIIICTGANQGLGFEIIYVSALRDPSSTYILACRNVAAGHEALQKLRSMKITAALEVVQLDVTSDEQIEAAAEWVRRKYGRLDVLVNNAGIFMSGATDRMSLRESYNHVLNTNLTSVAVITTIFLPLLHKSPDPKVINISSGLGSMTKRLALNANHSPIYGSSKVGLNGLTVHMQVGENGRVKAEEARGKKGAERVRFSTVAPGLLKTAFTGFMEGAKDPREGAEVVVRLGLDEEGMYEGGKFWAFEQGEMREVPW